MAANPIILEFQTKGLNEMVNESRKASDGLDNLSNSVSDAAIGIAELAGTVDILQKRLVTLDKASKEFKLLSDEIDAANIQLKAFTQSGDSMVKQVRDNTNELIRLRIQLKEMEDAGLTGTVAYKTLGKQFDAIAEKTGQLKGKIKDLQGEMNRLGSNTSGLDKLVRGVNLGVNAVTGLQAATALFGVESESLQKTLVQLNAAMLFSNSLQQIGTELAREDTIVAGLAATAKKAWAAATTLVTEASVGLRVALAALGIGALIAGILIVIKAVEVWKKATDAQALSTENLKKKQDELNDKLKVQLDYLYNIGSISKEQQLFEQLKNTKTQADEAEISVGKLIKKRNELLGQGAPTANTTLFDLQQIQAYQNEIDKLDKQILEGQALFNDRKQALNSAGQAVIDFYKKTDKPADEAKEKVKKIIDFNISLRKMEAERSAFYAALKVKADELQTQKEQDALKRIDTAREINHQKNLKRISEILAAQEASLLKQRTASAEREAAEDATANATQQKRIGYAQQGMQYIEGISNVIQNANAVRLQKELQGLEDKKNKGIINEKQYQKELAKIKNDAAKKDHRAAVIRAFLAIPLAILNALTSVPFPANIAAAAITGALALANAAIVAASPVPKFRHGGEVFRGHGFVKGKSHSMGGVNAELEGNEFVHRVEAVKHYGVDFMKNVNALKFPKAMAVKMTQKNTSNSVTNNEFGQELQYIGQYIKQGNEVTISGNNLLKRIAENTRTKNGYA